MRRLFIILFLCFTGWIASKGQIQPPVSPPAVPAPAAGSVLSSANSTLTSNGKKLKAQRDSALSATNHYVQPGKTKKSSGKDSLPVSKASPHLARMDSAAAPDLQRFVPTLDHPSCKMITFMPYHPDSLDAHPVTPPAPRYPTPPPPPPHVPFLQVHGNVLYNLNYYSLIDTPYNEHNIYQHTIQTWLDVLVKGQYPFRIFLTNHFSNSPLFHNYSDFNFSYNNSGFNQQIRNDLRSQYLQSLPSQKILDSLQQVLNNDLAKLRGLNQWGRNPALIQRMVEERELALKAKLLKDSTATDSTSALAHGKADEAQMDSIYAHKKRDADSISREIARLEQLLQSTRQFSQTQVNQNLAAIQQLDNPSAVRNKLPAMGLSDSSLPKGYKALMAVKSFNIGRSVVNYSELSARNISIDGIQAEYNPGLYYAVAAGAVDYRFRDFVIQQPDQPQQYMSIFRIGEGLKGGNSVILTYFTGRRQLYSATASDTSTIQVPSSFLMGLTLEGNYHITKNILFTGEIAKSSSPYYAGDSSKSSDAAADLFRMNDHSNEAWSVKVNASFPGTNTRVQASYKHLAENYQSFSIFTDGSAQSAWSVNLDQLFFKKQLDIRLGANTNDFSNPLVGEEYSSTTVFKSIQATLRMKNWPIISLGYFPSSQITKLGDGQYIENLFYTLVGNMTQSYSFHHVLMNTTVAYTQFYNKAADSGFTYFNTRNLMLSQSVFLSKFTLQLNATGSTNQDYDLYTLEGKVQHTVNKWLTVGAGVKYNWQTVYNIDQMGYSAEATLRLNRLGQIQFSADKGFIPGMNNVLVPDNTGRLTYFKTF